MQLPGKKGKQPSLDDCKRTLAILTCDCFTCNYEKAKLNMRLLEESIAINYCKKRIQDDQNNAL